MHACVWIPVLMILIGLECSHSSDICDAVPFPCSHQCWANTAKPSEYTCACAEWFELLPGPDGVCRATEQRPALIVATMSDIFGHFEVNHIKFYQHGIQRLRDTAYHEEEGHIFWIDRNVIRVVTDTGRGAIDVINQGLIDPRGLSLDWLNRLLYITDELQVLACTLDGTACVVIIHTNIEDPFSIVVHPSAGQLFWSDIGTTSPRIEICNGDGSNRRPLVNEGLVKPVGLTMDVAASVLYWMDLKTEKVECIRTDGTARRVIPLVEKGGVFAAGSELPFPLAVFEDSIYWGKGGKILASQKRHTQEAKLIDTTRSLLVSLTVHHPQMQPSTGPRPCHGLPCTHLCLPSGDGGFVCACPKGLKLHPADRTTCVESWDKQFLLVSTPSSLLQLFPQRVGRGAGLVETIATWPKHTELGDVTYDNTAHRIYFSNVLSNALMSMPLNNTLKQKREVNHHTGKLEGLVVDSISRNIYWTDAVKKTVEMMSLQTGERLVLIDSGLSKPRGVAVDTDHGYLFYTDWGSNSRVMRCTLAGRNCTTLFQRESYPNHVIYDSSSQRVFWTDALSGYIQSMDTAGNHKVVARGHHPYSLVVLDDYIYWTEMEQPYLFWCSKFTEGAQRMYGQFDLGPQIISLRSLVVVNPMEKSNRQSGCTVDGGGCSHVCVMEPPGRGEALRATCLCPEGMKLAEDGLQCQMDCGEGSMRCGTDCIQQRDICDGWSDCKEDEDEQPAACAEKACGADHRHCSLGPGCVEEDAWCDNILHCHDGSDEADCSCQEMLLHCTDMDSCLAATAYSCERLAECLDESKDICKEWCFYHCKNSTICITEDLLCDGIIDCFLADDEINCSTDCDPASEWRCDGSSTCIDLTMTCDGIEDCEDGTDEHLPSCPQRTTVPVAACEGTGGVRCGDGTCVDKEDVCDGFEHCEDGADEKDQRCHQPSTTMSPSLPPLPDRSGQPARCGLNDMHYLCRDLECLPMHQVCDGDRDCEDGTDEGPACDSACISNNGGCDHECWATPYGSVCSCRPGYVLAEDGRACEDIDECAFNEPHERRCNQRCHNSPGSYKCQCESGYTYSPLHSSCKANGDAWLMYAAHNSLYNKTLHEHRCHLVNNAEGNIISFDYDARSKDIFWLLQKAVVHPHPPAFAVEYSSVMDRNTKYAVYHNLTRSGDVALDWVTGAIYVTDEGIHRILVCQTRSTWSSGGMCAELARTSPPDVPKYLALHPPSGAMFHVEQGPRYARILRSGMDGRQSKVIVQYALRIRGLAVDVVSDLLYWVDAVMGSLHMTDFDGKQSHAMVVGHRNGLRQPSGLALFEDSIMWTDLAGASRSDRQVWTASKRSGENLDPIKLGHLHPRVIRVAHVLQQPTVSNPCVNNRCDGLCLMSQEGEPSCLCPLGSQPLTLDQSRCTLTDTPSLPSKSMKSSTTQAKPATAQSTTTRPKTTISTTTTTTKTTTKKPTTTTIAVSTTTTATTTTTTAATTTSATTTSTTTTPATTTVYKRPWFWLLRGKNADDSSTTPEVDTTTTAQPIQQTQRSNFIHPTKKPTHSVFMERTKPPTTAIITVKQLKPSLPRWKKLKKLKLQTTTATVTHRTTVAPSDKGHETSKSANSRDSIDSAYHGFWCADDICKVEGGCWYMNETTTCLCAGSPASSICQPLASQTRRGGRGWMLAVAFVVILLCAIVLVFAFWFWRKKGRSWQGFSVPIRFHKVVLEDEGHSTTALVSSTSYDNPSFLSTTDVNSNDVDSKPGLLMSGMDQPLDAPTPCMNTKDTQPLKSSFFRI